MKNWSLPKRWNPRLFLVCFFAIAISLPIAWISLAKVLLFIGGGIAIAYSAFSAQPNNTEMRSGRASWVSAWVLIIVLAFAIGLAWTDVPLDFAALVLVKHAKLLSIALIIHLLRNEQESRTAVKFWMYGQSCILLCSWLLAMGVPFPFVTGGKMLYVVFSESYIDQSIMFAISAAAAWHLRDQGLWSRWTGIVLTLMFLADVLVLLPGRTGYVLAFSMITLITFWAMPKRIGIYVAIVVAAASVGIFYFSSDKVRTGLDRVWVESHQSDTPENLTTSSGWRINAWHRSIQAIEESPVFGHGTGSWSPSVKKFEGANADQTFGLGNSSNPHQEYLLWGVELGLPGMALLLGLMCTAIKDTGVFLESSRRAILSVLACIALACLFNSSLFDDLIGDYLCVVLGLLLAYGRTSSPGLPNEHHYDRS